MLLQTRPDLALIAVVGLLVAIVFLVNMAQNALDQPPTTDAARRNFLQTFVALFVTIFLLAYTLPSAIDTFSEESCWLTVEGGQTYQISSGENEEYCGARVDGTLNLNGTMELSGAT